MNGVPLTFADLRALEKAQEASYEATKLSEQFQMLTANILASDIGDKPSALKALADEYAALVANTLSVSIKKDGAKYVIRLAPSERTKAILGELSKPKPATGVTNFFPRNEAPPLESTLFSPERLNGKVNH